MKIYAVGFIDLSDFESNELKICVIEATSWKEALARHPSVALDENTPDDLSWLSDDMQEAKNEILCATMYFDVVEIQSPSREEEGGA